MPNENLPPCDCSFLENQANIPDSPIEFDPGLKEYSIKYTIGDGSKAGLRIYHCPFCGGKAPKSKRELLFATLSNAEQKRLMKLFWEVRTLDDVLREFGQPDADLPVGAGMMTPEKEGKPGITELYRTLIYKKLSDTADVHVKVHPSGSVGFSFTGKYIGQDKT